MFKCAPTKYICLKNAMTQLYLQKSPNLLHLSACIHNGVYEYTDQELH